MTIEQKEKINALKAESRKLEREVEEIGLFKDQQSTFTDNSTKARVSKMMSDRLKEIEARKDDIKSELAIMKA